MYTFTPLGRTNSFTVTILVTTSPEEDVVELEHTRHTRLHHSIFSTNGIPFLVMNSGQINRWLDKTYNRSMSINCINIINNNFRFLLYNIHFQQAGADKKTQSNLCKW